MDDAGLMRLRQAAQRLDSQRRWDFSAKKIFKLAEKRSMEFRADTFNALNEVVLRLAVGPQTLPSNPSTTDPMFHVGGASERQQGPHRT